MVVALHSGVVVPICSHEHPVKPFVWPPHLCAPSPKSFTVALSVRGLTARVRLTGHEKGKSKRKGIATVLLETAMEAGDAVLNATPAIQYQG
jgi:hypothetical protein